MRTIAKKNAKRLAEELANRAAAAAGPNAEPTSKVTVLIHLTSSFCSFDKLFYDRAECRAHIEGNF
jgi:hypothetical protein